MRPPRLHLVTDAGVLQTPSFETTAAAVLEACGAEVALHLRGHGVSGRALFEIGTRMAAHALRTGAWLLVNDRVDVAMVIRANGVQLGARSLAVAEARMLLGAGARIGVSTHAAAEIAQAAVEGADFVLLGNIWETASHPGRAALGAEELARSAQHSRLPVIAIGGVTAERVADAAGAGAHGVAVLGAVWRAAEPAAAAAALVTAVRQAWSGA